MWFRFFFFLLQTQILTDLPIWIQTKISQTKNVTHCILEQAHRMSPGSLLACCTLSPCWYTPLFYTWTWWALHMLSLHTRRGVNIAVQTHEEGKQKVRRVWNCESPMWQPSSSLRSGQWWVPSHWRAPAIQVPSRHLNWSWVQVGRPVTVKRSRSKPRYARELVRGQKIGPKMIRLKMIFGKKKN